MTAVVTISRQWPDEDTLQVSVAVDVSYPDAVAEAKRCAVDAWREACGVVQGE